MPLAFALFAYILTSPAQAAGLDMGDMEFTPILPFAFFLVGVLGILLFVQQNRRFATREKELLRDLDRASIEIDRIQQFVAEESQIVVVWNRADSTPHVEGDLSLVADMMTPQRLLMFSNWLDSDKASQMDVFVNKLLSGGEAFRALFEGLRGRHFEILGRAIGGNAVMRIRDISDARLELVRLQGHYAAAQEKILGWQKLLDAIPHPAWLRGRDGKLTWCNRSFYQALETGDNRPPDPDEELFDRETLRAAAEARVASGLWQARVLATVAGKRRPFNAFEIADSFGSAGVAIDVSESDRLRTEKERLNGAYKNLLDRLTTAVAIFDSAKRLDFYNSAYMQAWSLDPAFLDLRPTDSEILDRLRANRLLPEQSDFRAWKAQLLSAYQSTETTETVWHLPDGRALRVSVGPNAEGGVTYLYDDATQSFALTAQINSLTRLQGETLDALKEGVAVFGADGRLRLANPALLTIWRLPENGASTKLHFDDLSKSCLPLLQEPERWESLRGAALGFHDERRPLASRLTRNDGKILECAALPLPDGSTLMTFFDVTDSENAARALEERNAALISAEKLRNDFVKHVSYELRTPLTNIIGFTQLLADGGAGALTIKQLEYAGYIRTSSTALLAIINDILDLASIDAGALELRIESMDVTEAMKAAAIGIEDRLREAKIELRLVATDDVGIMWADARRIRQVLFNLLSNAIGFSQAGQTVTLAAMRRGEDVVFKVSDRGRGIPPEALEKVFDRFESNVLGTRHRGPGLGLSMVRALVELHGGRVMIDSVVGEGTMVTCVFPLKNVANTSLAVS